jgi:hypothetical protein
MIASVTKITNKHAVLTITLVTHFTIFHILQNTIIILELRDSWFHRDSADNFALQMVSNEYEVKRLSINWAHIGLL